jgi:prolyl oligopeptidase PreP (S9A serine peptidase family)
MAQKWSYPPARRADVADDYHGIKVPDPYRCLVAGYLKDAHIVLRVLSLDGDFLREIELPGPGMAYISGKREEPEMFYTYESFTHPPTHFRYDVESAATSVFRKPEVDFDSSSYESKQVFFQSRDGTRIPMFITHRKGLKPDGSNPTLLYGYGGFNVSMTPGFSVTNTVWFENGGGKPLSKEIEESADFYAFLFRIFGIEPRADAAKS